MIRTAREFLGKGVCAAAVSYTHLDVYKRQESILAKETISCMQAGIVFGQIGQTEYIVKKIKEESGYVDAKVVASGGLGKIITNETDIIDVYDPQLTLKGLRMIYEKNKR